jgi:hypothetical protein
MKLNTVKAWKVMLGTESMIWQGIAQQIIRLELTGIAFRVKDAERVVRSFSITNRESIYQFNDQTELSIEKQLIINLVEVAREP